jgi:hypothetical protein
MHGQAVLVLEKKCAASWIENVIGADRVLDDRHHRSLARRRRPEKVALGRMQTMEMARPSGMKELLIVMKIKAVEIRALTAAGLSNSQDLPSP